MSKKFFVNDEPTENGKYRVLQQDSETAESFGVEDFDTLEEARDEANRLQSADDLAASENPTGHLPPIGELSHADGISDFQDTPQDLKDTTSQE